MIEQQQTITIAGANWTQLLATAIQALRDGDTLIVATPAQQELAARALTRMRPDLRVTVQVMDEDEGLG